MRTGEAKWVEWRHCDFTRGEILVVGDPQDATKNGEHRRPPMIPALRELLQRIQKERGSDGPTAHVLKVHEAQKAMDRAFKALKMERFTHHDLRHYFATICIESGFDIPTGSKWMGHKDGGALAMKVYGHFRNEHSLAAAQLHAKRGRHNLRVRCLAAGDSSRPILKAWGSCIARLSTTGR